MFKTPIVSIKLVSDILDSKTQESDYKKFEDEADVILKETIIKVIQS